MIVFRIILVAAWAVVLYFTILPLSSEGLSAANDVFAADLSASNWRTQFDVDLLSHMLLAGIWVAWRQKFSLAGILLGLLCIGGSLFTLIYVLALTLVHKGDLNKVVMGKNFAGKVA